MQAKLLPDKLERGREAVKTLLSKPVFSYREFESLVGFLLFAAKVITPGRTFLRRQNKLIRINRHIRADLTWWQAFLQDWNGIRLLRLTKAKEALHIWTDASGKYDIGGFLLKDPTQLRNVRHVFSSRFPSRLIRMDI